MGRLLSVFAAVGILGAATVALAAEATYRTTGKIKSVDLMRHVITLENSSTYKVARGVNIMWHKGRPEGEPDHLRIWRDHRSFGDHAGRLNAGWLVPVFRAASAKTSTADMRKCAAFA